MSVKTILITGATDGLGRAVAEALATRGHTLLLHGRSAERLATVAASVETRVRTYCADLASLAEVRRLSDELLANEPRIDVLIANAGIAGGPPRQSADGYELHFAVNYLSQFVLVTRLLERLRASAPARVVLISSLSQVPIDFDDVMLERGYDYVNAYAQSKLAQIAFGFRLAAQHNPGELTVTSLHPGTLMPTKLVHEAGLTPIDSLESGVEATVKLAIDPAVDGITGVFFDRMQIGSPDPWASDWEMQERLWLLSKHLTMVE